MTIGSLLKHQRIAMGLTQKEFSNGIISAAHYSKIENNKHEISATDLFLLLKQNQIDLIDFYNDLYFSNDKVDIINKSILISQAFYKKDKEKVRLLNNLIQNSSVSEEEKLRASLMQAILDGTLADMSNKMKKRIKKSLFEHDYWFQNERYLKLLSNSLIVFDNIEIQYYFNQIYEAYYNEIDIQPYGLLKIIAAISINCLHITYVRHDNIIEKKVVELLDKFPQVPDFFVYQTIKNYYVKLFDGKKEDAETIKQFMKQNGLNGYVENLASQKLRICRF